MKRIITLLFLVAASSQLKAQQVQMVPNPGLTNGFPKNYFKADSLQNHITAKADAIARSDNFNAVTTITIVYSTMPVLKLSPSNVERMPVAGMGQSNTNYPMMVDKVTVVNPLAPAKLQQP